MKLNKKLILINVLLPMALIIVLVMLLQNLAVKRAEAQADKDLAFELSYIVSKLENNITEKKQYLQDQASLQSTVDLYYSAENSFEEDVWLQNPAYTQWQEQFAGSEQVEKDILKTFVGYKGIDRALALTWLPIPDTYQAYKRPWFTGTVEENGFYITSPYLFADQDDRRMGVSMGYPIYKRGVLEGSQNDIIGVAAVDLELGAFRQEIQALEEEFSVIVGLYDKNGGILYDGDYESLIEAGIIEPSPTEVTTFVDFIYGMDTSVPREEVEGLFQLMKSGEGVFHTDFEGNTIIVAHSPIIDGQWVINISRPLSFSTKEAIRQGLINNAFIALCLAIILGLSTLFINLTVIRNIVKSSDALTEISKGDADLTVSMKVQSNDEIAQLGASFNAFVDKLRNWIIQIKEVISNTENVSQDVSSSTEETTAAVEETTAILKSVGSEITNLDINMAQSVSSIEQINSNMTSMDEQITNQAAMVEESTAAITEMIASLDNVDKVITNKQQSTKQLTEKARDGKSKIEKTSEAFKRVVEYIDSIQEMAQSINGIASQTNLLSMNAAIEAAHAGDSGRGFAVVAEEIRKLAATAAESSSNITSLIKNISATVTETDINVQDTSRSFEEISVEVQGTVDAFAEINQAIKELNLGGQQVLKASEEINDVTLSIQAGSGEIKNGTASILNSSESVKEISNKVNGAMKEVITGNNEILEAMGTLVSLATRLDEIVEQLKTQFGGFRT